MPSEEPASDRVEPLDRDSESGGGQIALKTKLKQAVQDMREQVSLFIRGLLGKTPGPKP